MSLQRKSMTRHVTATTPKMPRKPICTINSSNGKKNFVPRKWLSLSRTQNTKSPCGMPLRTWRASWEWMPPFTPLSPVVLKLLKCNHKHFTLKNGISKRIWFISQFKSPQVTKLLSLLKNSNPTLVTNKPMKRPKCKTSLIKLKLKDTRTSRLLKNLDLTRPTEQIMKPPSTSLRVLQSPWIWNVSSHWNLSMKSTTRLKPRPLQWNTVWLLTIASSPTACK